MNDVLRIARLKIALQRAFLGRAILLFTKHKFIIYKLKVGGRHNAVAWIFLLHPELDPNLQVEPYYMCKILPKCTSMTKNTRTGTSVTG